MGDKMDKTQFTEQFNTINYLMSVVFANQNEQKQLLIKLHCKLLEIEVKLNETIR